MHILNNMLYETMITDIWDYKKFLNVKLQFCLILFISANNIRAKAAGFILTHCGYLNSHKLPSNYQYILQTESISTKQGYCESNLFRVSPPTEPLKETCVMQVLCEAIGTETLWYTCWNCCYEWLCNFVACQQTIFKE